MRLLLILLVLLPVVASAGPATGWRNGWGLVRAPETHTTDADAGDGDGAIARLRLEHTGNTWRARIDNRIAGPVQVALRLPRARTPMALASTRLLPAAGSTVFAGLPAPTGDTPLDLRLLAVPGDPDARPGDVAYLLPFDARRIRVSQPPQGHASHRDAENRDAVDFTLPEGTPVLAARAGTVMQVQDRFRGSGQDARYDGQRANFIRLLHADGSMSVYAHLQPGGIQVRPGQPVETGQPIGLSGNTGYSTAPHLHFVVQVNRGMQLHSIPVRLLGPQGELRFATEAPAD